MTQPHEEKKRNFFGHTKQFFEVMESASFSSNMFPAVYSCRNRAKEKKTSTRLSHPRYFNVDLLWAYTKSTDGHKIRIDQCPVLISPLEFRPERSPLPLISLIFFCNDMLFLAIDLTCCCCQTTYNIQHPYKNTYPCFLCFVLL